MLDSFRQASNSWYVKILFGILMLAFGGWGIGDVTRMRLDSAPAITVGHHDFSPAEVAEEFRRDVEQIGKQFHGQLTMEQARQFGLLQRTIDQIVSRTLLDEGAKGLGLGVDDETLRQNIAAIPAFQDELHNFDKNTYHRALAGAQMSEHKFIAMERADITRQQLVQAIGGGVTAPTALVEPLDRFRREQRIAETITFAPDKMPAPPAPDEATLKTFYGTHADQFMAPETRAITALSVRVDDLKGDIKPSDSDISKAYEARAGEFQTPEKRAVRQIVFTDQAKAQAFAAKLGANGDFDATAKADGQSVIDLGQIEQKDLPLPELAEAAFSAPKTGIVGPVQSTLGWHVLDITAIVPGTLRPLADVRNDIVAGLVKDEATNRLYALSTKLEDTIGSGASIEEAATTVGVKPLILTSVDMKGNDASGKPAAGLPRTPEFMGAVFETGQGTTSEVGSYHDGSGYFVVHVDKITPAAQKPFEAIKADLLALWIRDRQAETARQQADSALERLKKGDTLAAVAGSFPIQTTKPFLRAPAQGGPTPPALAADVFKLAAPGDATVVVLPEGPTLARLKEIIPVDPQHESLETPKAQLSESLSADLLQEYVSALRKDLGVRVDTALIDKQFQK